MRSIFHNAKVYVERETFAQAVLVEDGIISAVGSNEEILAMQDDDTTVTDLCGRTMLPGFNDSHLHLLGVGDKLVNLSLYGVTSITEVVEKGRQYIKDNNIPAGAIIYGNSWNQDLFTDESRELTRHDLDRISTEHILICPRVCGHIISVNSLALEQIKLDSLEYEGGSIDIDADGKPLGIFRENAMQILDAIQKSLTVDEMALMIKAAMEKATSFGITSVQTNDAYFNNYPDVLEAYDKVLTSGKSTLRIYHQCYFNQPEDFKAFLDKGYYTGKGDSMEKIGPLKLFIDGSLGARTALMRSDYADAPGVRGIECLTQAQIDELVKIANNNNIQVAVHAIGDRAIEMILNSYEKVIENGNNYMRHGIIHCQITDKALLQRFKDMKIIAYVQPIFLNCDLHNAELRVGKELASTSYAFNTMNQIGIPVAYGTDAPVEPFVPLNNIHCAVNRQDLTGYPASGWNMQEAVDVYRAIDDYTIGSAFASFDEKEKGRIKPGFLADMVVLDKDIFTVPSSEIQKISAVMTILGGEILYQI